MAVIGGKKSKAGSGGQSVFDRPPAYLQAVPPITASQVPTLPAANVPEMRPGFLAQGGIGRSIAGHIGDALMQQAGMSPTFAAAVAHHRAQQAELARAEAMARFQPRNFSPAPTMEQVAAPEPAAPAAPAAPPPGSVVDGHIFLGGDPADRKSWYAMQAAGRT